VSTNQADIQIDVQLAEINRLVDKVEQLERDLDKAGDEAKKSEREFSSLGRAMVVGGSAAVGLAVAVEAAKKAFEAVKRVVELATVAVEAFAETNQVTAGLVEGTAQRFTELQSAIGGAIVGADDGRRLFGAFNETLDFLRQIVDANQEAIGLFVERALVLAIRSIQFAIEVVGNLVKGFNNLKLVLPLIERGLVHLEIGVIRFGNSLVSGILDVVGDVAEGLSEFLEFLEATANRIPGVNISLDGTATSLDNLSASTEESRRQLERQSAALQGAADRAEQEYAAAVANVAEMNARVDATVQGATGSLDELVFRFQAGATAGSAFVAATSEVTGAVDDTNDVLATTIGLLGNMGVALLSSAAVIENEYIAGQTYMTEQLRLAEEERLRIAEEAAEREAQIAEERAAKQRQIGEEIGSQANNLAIALISAEGKSAKERRKILKQALGQEMVTKGQAFLAESIPTAFVNPVRAGLLAAAGSGLIAAGAKFGGSGGGGGGRGGGQATPRQAVSTQNVVFNQSTSFGFVGDRRAATREIEDINRASIDRGLRS